jgi:low molecular weight protein-tyrosine phosphatase
VPATYPADLPGADPRLHVCVVCSGNICRSPIGEQVLRSAIAEAGLADQVRVSSAGTGDWHIGQRANRRAVKVLRGAGYATDHLARQITPRELAGVDLALAADRGHLRELRAMTQDHAKVALLRSFDPGADDEVPDPYYGPDSGFDEVLAMTEAAAPGVIAEIRRLLHERKSFERTSGAPAGNGR